MEFAFSPEAEVFREEIQAFLRHHPPESFPEDGMDAGYGSGAHSVTVHPSRLASIESRSPWVRIAQPWRSLSSRASRLRDDHTSVTCACGMPLIASMWAVAAQL